MSQHSDPGDLALRALGENLPELDEHLATCAECRRELAQLRSVVTTARTVQPEDQPVAPPAAVWEAVVAELGLTGAAAGTAAGAAAGVAAGEAAGGAARTGAGEAGGDELAARRARAGRRGSMLLAAAAAVLGIAVGAIGAALLLADDEGPTSTQVVAQAELAALPQHEGSGSASVRTSDDGRVLVLDVSGLSQGDGFYEVWLLDSQAQRLVSLGLLEGDRGEFPLPAEVDVSQFPVVDVSIEPVDGDPAHSGDSVVRGTLSS